LGKGVGDGRGVGVGERVGVGVLVMVGVLLGVGVWLAVGLRLGVRVELAVGVMLGVRVSVGVLVIVGVSDGVAVSVGVAGAVGKLPEPKMRETRNISTTPSRRAVRWRTGQISVRAGRINLWLKSTVTQMRLPGDPALSAGAQAAVQSVLKFPGAGSV
jgi:hypothetical protein